MPDILRLPYFAFQKSASAVQQLSNSVEPINKPESPNSTEQSKLSDSAKQTQTLSGFPLGRLDDFLATHVGTHGLRDDNGAVFLLVVLEDSNQPTGGGQRTVQRGNGAGTAIFHTFANVQTTRLVFGAVGGGGQLAVAALGRNPSLAVELTSRGGAQIDRL